MILGRVFANPYAKALGLSMGKLIGAGASEGNGEVVGVVYARVPVVEDAGRLDVV